MLVARMPVRLISYFTTQEVADLVGVTKRTVQNWLKSGFIAEPERNPANRYRLWTEGDVRQIQQRIRERNIGTAGHL